MPARPSILKKSGKNLTIDLGSGVKIAVDLSSHRIDEEQNRILNKAVKALQGATVAQLTANACPAQPHLEPAEFQRIRGLKAKFSSSGAGAADGLVCDFCLKCVKV